MHSFSEYIYLNVRKYIVLSIIILFSVLLFIITSVYFYSVVSPILQIKNNIDSYIVTLTKQITQTSILMESIFTNEVSTKNTLKYPKIDQVFRQIYSNLDSSSIVALGYAVNYSNNKYQPRGIYIYKDSNSIIQKIDLAKYYNKNGDNYTKHVWFKKVISTNKQVFFSPQVSEVGIHETLLTYVFPIHIANNIAAVGVIDISIKPLEQQLDKIRAIKKRILGIISFYYVSKPYNGLHDDYNFYRLSTQNVVETKELSNRLNKVIHNKQNSWNLLGSSIYQTVSYMQNALSFIIEINLFYIVFFFLILIFIGLLLIYIILKLFRRLIERKIQVFADPINNIANLAQEFSMDNLSKSFSISKFDTIKELHYLSSSLEKMRFSIVDLVEKEKRLLRTNLEFSLAGEIYSNFIPQKIYRSIRYENYLFEFSVISTPANILSGDIYDVIIKDKEVFILLGDSSGKSITAMIFSLFVLMKFRLLCENLNSTSQIMRELNNYLCSMNSENMFISTICVKIDLTSSTAELSVAGHEMVLLFGQEGQQTVMHGQEIENNPVLGIIEDSEYQTLLCDLANLKYAFLFTDGITEASNENAKFYGRGRLKSAIKHAMAIHGNDIVKISDYIMEDVNKFEMNNSSIDDKSLLVISRHLCSEL